MKKVIFTIFFFFLLFLELLAQGITLNGKLYEVDTLNYHYTVGPGISFSSYNLPKFPLRFYVLEVDLNNPYIQMETCLGGGRAVATERPSSMAKRKSALGHQVVAATNGDFYFFQDPIEIGIPRSGQFTNRECVTNPTGRASFVLDVNKKPYVDRIDFSGKLIKGEQSTRLHTVNMLRLEAESEEVNSNLLSLYSSSYGTVTSDIKGGTKIIISPKDSSDFFFSANREIKCIVDSVFSNEGNSSIPEKKAVLHGRGTSSAFLTTLVKGDELTVFLETKLRRNPEIGLDLKELMGGSNHLLVRDGLLLDEGDALAHPRTGLGCSQDGTKVYSIVVDGRQGASKGVSLKDFSEIFLAVGAWHAVNLDGGGSSVMIVNDEVVNRTSDSGGERAVGNGLLFVSESPEDNTISKLEFESYPFVLPICAKFTPIVRAYNQYGILINKKLENFSLSCSEGIGFIGEFGDFVAAAVPGNGTITATYNGLSVTKEIRIKDSEIKLSLDSILIDNRNEYVIDLEGKIGDKTYAVSSEAFSWEVKDESICTLSNGMLKGIKNGRTQVIGTLNDFKDTLIVRVETTNFPQLIADNFTPSSWELKATKNLNAVFNTNNRPSAWNHGGVVNYVYKKGRTPEIKLSKKIQFYGRPDTIKIILNVGDIEFNKITLSLQANNDSKHFTKQFDVVNKNKDTELVLPVSELFDVSDQGIYPLGFNFVQFYLNPQIPDRAYALALKEIVLCYKGVSVGIDNPTQLSSVSIYPNPVRDGELYIRCDTNSKAIDVKIYDLQGNLLCSKSLSLSGGEAKLSIGEMAKGAYLFQINIEGNTESVKLIIQ